MKDKKTHKISSTTVCKATADLEEEVKEELEADDKCLASLIEEQEEQEENDAQ